MACRVEPPCYSEEHQRGGGFNKGSIERSGRILFRESTPTGESDGGSGNAGNRLPLKKGGMGEKENGRPQNTKA